MYLVFITQSVNYLKRENSHWSFTLYYSFFMLIPCILPLFLHQLHLQSLEILIYLRNLNIS